MIGSAEKRKACSMRARSKRSGLLQSQMPLPDAASLRVNPYPSYPFPLIAPSMISALVVVTIAAMK